MTTPTPRPPVTKRPDAAKQGPKTLPNPVVSQEDYLRIIHEVAQWQSQ